MTGLDLETCEELLRGSYSGRVVVPGDSRPSVLIRVAEERVHPGTHMHTTRRAMPAEDAAVLRRWVDEGAARD